MSQSTIGAPPMTERMPHPRTGLRTAMLVVAAVAVIVAVLTLVVSGGSSHMNRPKPAATEHSSVIGYAASALGLSSSQLRRELRTGRTLGEIADTTDGTSRSKLIADLYDQQAERIRKEGLPPRKERAELLMVHRQIVQVVDRSRRPNAVIRTSSSYLGISERELLRRLDDGETLAAIASATSGRSKAGLVDALVAARRHQLQVAQRQGAISPEVERRALERLRHRYELAVAKPGA